MTPQPCGRFVETSTSARASGPTTTFVRLPDVLKNATPASAYVRGERIVTPEIAHAVLVVVRGAERLPSDRDDVAAPSRRYGVVPASEPPSDGSGSMKTLSAPAPLSVSGFWIVRPFRAPTCVGE